MVSFAVKLIVLSLLSLCSLIYGSPVSISGEFHYTHNRQQLNTLYNQPVSSIQEYSRPLNMPGGKLLNKLGINHRGQVATLNDGQQFLVHKGKNFGKDSQTVVVDRRFMSNNWSPRGSPVDASYGKAPVRVGNLVNSGGANYNPLCNNCIHGSNRMQERFRGGK